MRLSGHRLSRPILFLAAIAVLPLLGQPAYGKDDDIYSLAAHVAKSLSRAHVKSAVLVSFSGPDGEVTSLGTFLADRVSDQLTLSKNKFVIVRKDHLPGDNLMKIQPSQASLDTAALEELKPFGGVVLLGGIKIKGDNVTISLHVVDVVRGKIIDHAEALIRRVMLPTDLPATASDSQTPQIYVPKRDTVTVPGCVFCPDPSFTEQARATGRQGTVVLSVVIAPSGRASEITVLKVVGDGLDERAIEAIRTWQFKPGLKEGKPVWVRVPIEVSFRRM
jgi:TonB family protein